MRAVPFRGTLGSMLRRFVHPRARALVLLGAIVWAWTGLAADLHELVVVHAVCVEHHEVVEVGRRGEASHARAAHPQISQGAVPAHDHGCTVHPCTRPVPAAPVRVARRGVRIRSVEPPAPIAAPPVGIPLEYAPKTSRPTA